MADQLPELPADRARFEAWAWRELKQDARSWKHPSGEYVYLESEWKAWQEATRQEQARCHPFEPSLP